MTNLIYAYKKKVEDKKESEDIKKETTKDEPKEDKKNDSITSTGINFVNGKIVATEELDKAMLENFGKCPSMSYFTSNYDDSDVF